MEFKPIKGYEGIYEACSDGTIWSCEGKTTYSNWHGRIRKRVWKRRKLKLQTQKRQRGGKRDKKVKLWKDGEMKTHLVSRLVATAFIPNPENKEEVNHKNGLLQTSKKVTLISKVDGSKVSFYSLRAASEFLGKNKGYLSNIIKSGRTLGNYEIVVGEL